MKRYLNLSKLLEKKSFFLFGPRGVGKSYLIRDSLDNCNYINLLKSETYLRLKANPGKLVEMCNTPFVAIDEIQRIPELLNEVHHLIEERGIRFLMTGSSARQLRKGGTNLLAGRALRADLFPLTWQELHEAGIFDLNKVLELGTLPEAYLKDIGQEYLYAYTETYLKEEIQAESLVRNLGNYVRFLEQAALKSGEILNFTSVANDAQLPANTVRDYFQILTDTLLGHLIEPWTKSTKRKAIQSAKFYFFDCGVANALRRISHLEESTDLYGRQFEQFICSELKAYLSYTRKHMPLEYWRSTSKFEVDFVIGGKVAIEVKAAKRVSERDHKGLRAIAEEPVKWERLLLVSKDPQHMKFQSGIEHMYWEDFFELLWKGEII